LKFTDSEFKVGSFPGSFDSGVRSLCSAIKSEVWLNILRSIGNDNSRKKSMGLAVYLSLIGCVFQAVSGHYAMLNVALLIDGFGIGMLSVVTPLYISEISPPEVRGSLLVLS
jgi:MFS family permease